VTDPERIHTYTVKLSEGYRVTALTYSGGRPSLDVVATGLERSEALALAGALARGEELL
jgi:hypothetical protein